MSNCRNCGAPYTGKARCEWCGTVNAEMHEAEMEIRRLEQEIEKTKLASSLRAVSSFLSGGFGNLSPAYVLDSRMCCCHPQHAIDGANNAWPNIRDRLELDLSWQSKRD